MNILFYVSVMCLILSLVVIIHNVTYYSDVVSKISGDEVSGVCPEIEEKIPLYYSMVCIVLSIFNENMTLLTLLLFSTIGAIIGLLKVFLDRNFLIREVIDKLGTDYQFQELEAKEKEIQKLRASILAMRTKYEQVDDDNKSNLDYIEELERKLKELELALIAINGLNEKYDLKDNTDIHTS
ncbi:hypothetical protein [Vibrio mediterranei]|uniref:hypothetical protein n=1 Tax=Vibrio mediterranei TaxID=689 RepID=UPI00148DBF26|nr:hypothetical protein [Vibrio mediterranei]NOH31001.1 hypothetical protein [Vibrio mediterranei]